MNWERKSKDQLKSLILCGVYHVNLNPAGWLNVQHKKNRKINKLEINKNKTEEKSSFIHESSIVEKNGFNQIPP